MGCHFFKCPNIGGDSHDGGTVDDDDVNNIVVKIGDRKGAATHAHISVLLISKNGSQSNRVQLKLVWHGDSGKTNVFPIDANLDSIDDIRINRNEDTHSQLYIQWIRVHNNEKAFIFPINRWMAPEWEMQFQEYDCVLPQFDKFPQQRKLELAKKKRAYAFGPPHHGLPCQVNKLPEGESFSNHYQWKLISIGARDRIDGMIKKHTTGSWKSLDDLGNVYGHRYPVPHGMHRWRSDFEFGWQRLTGCNPVMIQLCTHIPENFAVTNEMIQPSLEGMTIESAIEKKLLFIIDLKLLKNIECTDESKQICSPIALFFVNKSRELLPVAIQLFQDKADSNPVFLPTDDEYTWMFAKMWYNNADASYHQSVSHLGMTHLLVESIAAATHSCLSPSHPLFRLLAPHFLFLIAINSLAVNDLVCEGGWVDETMAMGRIGMFEIIRRRFSSWRLDVDGTLPKELESRGLHDPEVLPNYHYRDDALLLWNAIYKYVTAVVNAQYDTPAKISEDFELQNWHNTLSSPIDTGGCNIQGIPGNGSFQTSEEIAQTVTSTIYTSSVMHAAVNFGQYDNYGFPPHYPAEINDEPPTDKGARTEKHVLNALPDKETTLSVMEVTRLLSVKGTNGLGYFEVEFQFDPVGKNAVQRLIEDLRAVGATINKRNNQRQHAYTELHPDHVPNAISI